MTGPKPYSPDNPFAPGPALPAAAAPAQSPPRRYSTDNPFVGGPSGAGDPAAFSDVSGGASTTADGGGSVGGVGGGYGALAKLGRHIITGATDVATHPMATAERVMDATFFGVPRRVEALGATAGSAVRSAVTGEPRRTYDEIRAAQEQQRGAYKAAHPEAAIAADVGGSLLGGIKAASKLAPAGAGLLRQAAVNAGISGGQTLGDTGKPEDAATSAALGGVLTLALGGAGKLVRSIFSPKTAAEESAAILDDIASRAGVTREPAEQAAARMAGERAAATQPLYTAARGDMVAVTPEMRTVLEDPLFQQAHARAAQLAERQGKEFMPLYDTDGGVLDEASVATIQSMKRRINDILKEAKVGAAPRGPAGTTQTMADEEINAVRGMRRTLTGEAGKQSPAFAQAETKFAEMSQPITALRRGEKFLNKGAYPDAASIERELGRLTPEARQGFRQGALTALQRQADRQAETVTGYRRLLKNTDLQERVTALLPVSEREAFRDMVERQGIWDAIKRLQNAPFLNMVKPVTSTVQAGRILGKQAGLGAAGAVVENTARLTGGELAKYLAEAMRQGPEN